MKAPPPIIQLPQSVINCISAGEVIHQPCNVAKELLENSIDAGSKRISISIESGGFKLIKVTDDGCGISVENLPVACKRHTTSKLSSFSDLSKLSTFGFRGEALFSMSCVAHVIIHSKTCGEELSYFAQYNNGEINGKPIPEAGIVGTCIEVKDLFYNKPEKLRSIPDSHSQNKTILQMVSQYSLAFPNISFVVKIDNKEKLHTFGNAKTEDVIALIYSVDTASVLNVQVNFDDQIKANLFLGGIGSSKNLKGSAIFINDRLVKCDKIRRAVESVYSEFLMKGEKPFFLVLLYIPPQNVDVNVHPTKRDVAFSNAEQIKNDLCDAIRNHLKNDSSRKFNPVQTNSQKQKIHNIKLFSNSQTFDDNPIKSNTINIEQKYNKSFNDEIKSVDGHTKQDLHSFDPTSQENEHNELEQVSYLFNQEKHGNEQKYKLFNKIDQKNTIVKDLLSNKMEQKSTNFNEDKKISINKTELIQENNIDNEHLSLDKSNDDNVPKQKMRFGLNIDSLFTKDQSESQKEIKNTRQNIYSQTTMKMSIFDELKHEPSSQKYIRGDHKERTLEQTIALSNVSQYKKKEDRIIQLNVINDLKDNIKKEASDILIPIFQKHIFVGFIDLSDIFIQSDDTLYLCNLFSLTRTFFYQVLVKFFGNYGKINFEEPINLTVISFNQDLTILEQNKDMLKDFFNINIENGQLYTMPLLIPGYSPSFSSLPIFIQRIISEINWENEYECITGIINELSMLYAVSQEDILNEDITNRLQNELKNIIFPEMKTSLFIPSKELLLNKMVIKVRTVSEMYKIFERT